MRRRERVAEASKERKEKGSSHTNKAIAGTVMVHAAPDDHSHPREAMRRTTMHAARSVSTAHAACREAEAHLGRHASAHARTPRSNAYVCQPRPPPGLETEHMQKTIMQTPCKTHSDICKQADKPRKAHCYTLELHVCTRGVTKKWWSPAGSPNLPADGARHCEMVETTLQGLHPGRGLAWPGPVTHATLTGPLGFACGYCHAGTPCSPPPHERVSNTRAGKQKGGDENGKRCCGSNLEVCRSWGH